MQIDSRLLDYYPMGIIVKAKILHIQRRRSIAIFTDLNTVREHLGKTLWSDTGLYVVRDFFQLLELILETIQYFSRYMNTSFLISLEAARVLSNQTENLESRGISKRIVNDLFSTSLLLETTSFTTILINEEVWIILSTIGAILVLVKSSQECHALEYLCVVSSNGCLEPPVISGAI
ncbi:hypothetical protein J6590_011126 [Homalodisca vitripennis]|nr:hypothetical protein J6590_011126 [Homalodisca vitripennis]